MGAMPEEIEPLLAFFGAYETIEFGKNRYYKTHYNNKEIVIAYSKIGKVFASLTAATMIEKFGCQKLLFTGVAGAISRELKIGDLIIADKLSQHDLDITAFGHPYGYVPEGAVYVKADSALNTIAKEVAVDLGIELREGTIATGDQFVANEDRKNWIGETFKADALEMEGASVAVVCDASEVPFFVLRAISDSAGEDADISFDEFLETSAKVSADFVVKMLDKM
jgi:adenosylhomocysteine/aminodeoxyfutalosine nucleosidase